MGALCLNWTKLNATNYLVTEEPSLMFSIASVCQGLSSLASGGGEMRDPGNEVEAVSDAKSAVVWWPRTATTNIQIFRN